jgi:hypothetical protein
MIGNSIPVRSGNPEDLLRECIHKEILLSRFIVRDEVSQLEFAMCGKCWKKIKHLRGFTLVEQSHRKLETRAEKFKALRNVPF